MSPPKAQLLRLTAQNFRGIGHKLDLDLAPSTQSRPGWVLLVGENGTGKSSVVDALEYLVHGELAYLKRQDVKKPMSLRFYPDQDIALETEIRTLWRVPGCSEPLEWSTFYPYPEKLDIPEALRDTALQCRTRPFILRRAQILNFVNATGTERRRTIVELLGLDEWELIEKAWRQVRNDARKMSKEAEVQAEAFSERLAEQQRKTELALKEEVGESLVGKSPYELHELIELLRQRASQAQRALEQQVAALERRVEHLGRAHKQVQSLLNSLREWLPKVISFQHETQIEGQELLLRLLESGTRFLEERRPSICPLCGQSIKLTTVLQHVRQQHAALSKLKQQREKLEQERKRLSRQTTEALSFCRTLQSESYESMQEVLEETEKVLNALDILLQEDVSRIAVNEVDSWLDSADKIIADLERGQKFLVSQLHKTREQLGDTPRSEQLTRAIAALEDLVKLQENLAGAQRKRDYWENIAKLAEKVLKAFQESRQAILEELFAQMEGLFNEYWEAMHPGERVRFRLKTLAKGVGLDSEMQMGEIVKEGHPLTFLSEGHLDTLGLAIFLAFTQKFNHDLPFLVLDDVLTTVDHGHRQRVACLLAEKFADWHLILTTHDRLWGEQLRATARAYGIPVRFYRMRPWDPISGASVEEWGQEPWEYYYQVAEKMPALAIAGAGRELEKFLNIMRRMLRIAVPANPNEQYTIGELWDGFRSWVKRHWPQSIPEKWDKIVPNRDELLREIQKVEALWRMRNWSGSHYNEWAANVTSTEAEEFIDAVEHLVNQFRCPYENQAGQKCKAFIKYDPSTKVITCSKREAHHFELPGKA